MDDAIEVVAVAEVGWWQEGRSVSGGCLVVLVWENGESVLEA